MSFESCLLALTEALGRRVSLQEMTDWAELIETERLRRRAEGYPDDYLSAAKSVADESRALKAIAQRNILLNKVAYQQATAVLEGIGDAALGMEALRVGINRPAFGSRLSVDARGKALLSGWTGGLVTRLREETKASGIDHLKYFLAIDNGLEITKALRGEPATREAVKVAEIINTTREAARAQENRAGSWRGKLAGYVTRQTHDPMKVQRAGFEQWFNDFLQWIDPGRTLARDAERLTMLRAEREMIGRQLHDEWKDLRSLAMDLRVSKAGTLARRARQAEGRAGTAETREETMTAQLEERGMAYGATLARYLDLAEQTRAAMDRRQFSAAQANLNSRGLRRQLAEARLALSREHQRVQELHRQHQAATGAATHERGRADRLGDMLQAAVERFDAIERRITLANQLFDKLGEYEVKLREPVQDVQAYAQDIYNKITANQWMTVTPEGRYDGVASFIGPLNVGKRRSAHREIHFKDAESEHAYAMKYGQGTLAEGIVRELRHAADATALMETFGPNARANHDRLIQEQIGRAQDRNDVSQVVALNSSRHDRQFKELDGSTRSVNNPTLAMWGSAWRAIQSMAKLGGATITSIGDIATVASELRYQGVGFLEAYRASFAGLLRIFPRADQRREFADLIGVGHEALIGTLHSNWHTTDGVPGFIASLNQKFFKLNLLTYWTDGHKITAALTTARHFANLADTTFDALPVAARRLLDMYGIDARRWDVLRTYGVRTGDDGVRFLLIDGVETIPLGVFYDIATDRFPDVVPSERWLRDARDRLVTSWRTLLVDRTDFAVITPGARERATMNWGTPRGDPLGEALRLVMQFKGYPIAAGNKLLGRALNGQPLTAGSMLGMAGMMVELSVMGYLAMTAKDFIKGKEPREPMDAQTILASIAQGGGFGLYGDFVFGEYSRFGRSGLASLAGPTFGQIDDLMEILHKAKDGEWAAMGMLRTIVGNTPGASLFYVRPVMDMLFLYQVYETLSPGFTRRLVARMQQNEGRGFMPGRDPREFAQ